MPGPKKRTPQRILEYQIRTQLWLEFLMGATNAKSINHLGAAIDGTSERGGTKWADYANLRKASFPNETTLKIADSFVPGSFEAFVSGPNNSRLFDCMWYSIDEIHELVGSGALGISHQLFWLNQLLPYGHLRQCDDDGLAAVIGGITKILESNTISLRQNLEIGVVPTQLSFLSGCIAVLRFAIERDNYHQYSYVIEMIDIIAKYFDSRHKATPLSKRQITNLLLTWVYIELDRWASFSQSGSFYRYNGSYPSKETFVSDPGSFSREYEKISSCSINNFAEGSISMDMDITGDENRSYFHQVKQPRI